MTFRQGLAAGPQLGRMLNPSVEPSARRESAQARRGSAGTEQRIPGRRSAGGGTDGIAASARAAAQLLTEDDGRGGESRSSAAAEEARNHRRSIGLKVWFRSCRSCCSCFCCGVGLQIVYRVSPGGTMSLPRVSAVFKSGLCTTL